MVKQYLTWKKFLLPRISISLNNRRGISMCLWRVLSFDLWFLPGSTFSLVLQKLSPISQSTHGGPILYFIYCYKHFTTLLLRSKLQNESCVDCMQVRAIFVPVNHRPKPLKKNLKKFRHDQESNHALCDERT